MGSLASVSSSLLNSSSQIILTPSDNLQPPFTNTENYSQTQNQDQIVINLREQQNSQVNANNSNFKTKIFERQLNQDQQIEIRNCNLSKSKKQLVVHINFIINSGEIISQQDQEQKTNNTQVNRKNKIKNIQEVPYQKEADINKDEQNQYQNYEYYNNSEIHKNKERKKILKIQEIPDDQSQSNELNDNAQKATHRKVVIRGSISPNYKKS